MTGDQAPPAPVSQDPIIDYLNEPPQRYAHVFCKASGSREMEEASEGEWVKFDDMDLYMFEGGQLMLQMAEQNKQLRAENAQLRRRVQEYRTDD